MAKRKKKSGNALKGLGIAVVLILVIISIVFFVNRNTSIGTPKNFNIFSITSPIIKASNPNLQNYDFLIYGSFDGAEKVIGEISTQREDYTGLKPISFSASAIQEKIVYSIKQDKSQPIYKYKYTAIYEKKNSFGVPNGEISPCPSEYPQEMYVEDNNKLLLKRDVRHCYQKIISGYAGELKAPSVKTSAMIKLSNGDEIIEQEVSTGTQESIPTIIFNSETDGRIGQLELKGGLVSGEQLPLTTEYKPVIYETGNWYFISRDSWTSYLTQRNQIFSPPINKDNDEQDVITYNDNFFKLINNNVDRFIYTEIPFVEDSYWIDRKNKEKGEIGLELDRKIASQTFTLRVNAVWVGIELLSGEPEITSLSCPAFTIGNEGKIIVEVKNVGDTEGKFYTQVSGCDPITQKYNANSEAFYLGAGDKDSIDVELITGKINSELSNQCTVKVFDSLDPDNNDVDAVTCKVSKLKLCQEGQEFLSDNDYCVNVCVNGEVDTRARCCASPDTQKMQSQANGKYVCVDRKTPPPPPSKETICDDGIDNDKDGKIDKEDSDCNVFTLKEILPYILAGVFGLLSLGLGYSAFAKPQGKKKADPVLTTIVVLFSAGIGLLVYFVSVSMLDFLFSLWGVLTIILFVVLFVLLKPLLQIAGFIRAGRR